MKHRATIVFTRLHSENVSSSTYATVSPETDSIVKARSKAGVFQLSLDLPHLGNKRPTAGELQVDCWTSVKEFSLSLYNL